MLNETAKVLVVDDLEDNRNVLGRRLARMGCDVSMATNGREALESIRKNDPEIVLLDIMMPDVNGFDVIREVRAGRERKRPSIIAVSARHDAESITRALNMGANDYVTKPYDFPVVWARVEKQIDQLRSASLLRDVNTRLTRRLHEQRPSVELCGGDSQGAVEALIRTALDAAQRIDLQSRLDYELRSRFNEMIGVSHHLRRFDDGKAARLGVDEGCRRIDRISYELLGILDDLTDFLSLQRGLAPPADMEVNLRAAVLHAWEMLDRRCDASAATIEIFTDDPNATIKGAAHYVRRAIGAVLMNAVRFNEKPPAVKVRLGPFSDHFYRLVVEDNGVGIPPEIRDDVLIPFYQGDNPITRKVGGLGLGLTIANSVMTLHNGKLKLDDAPCGPGTCVELYFPTA